MKKLKQPVIWFMLIVVGILVGYRYGVQQTTLTNEDLAKKYKQNIVEQTLEDNPPPECHATNCPEYAFFDADGDGLNESIVTEYTTMTQQAGRIWIIDEGRVVFKSKEYAQISVSPAKGELGGFVLHYNTTYALSPDFLNSYTSDNYIYKNGAYVSEGNGVLGQKVTYYAELKRFSTSGDMRFFWYDWIKKQRINTEDEYSWFFALPTKVPADEQATADWVKYIEDNKGAIFIISGTREPDDCGYYGSDHCIQSINIEKIEVVAK